MFFTCSHTGHNVALPPPLLLSHPPLGCVRIPPALVSDWIVYMDPSLSCFSLAPFFHSLAPRRRVALPNHLVLTLLSLSLSLQLATRTSKSSLQNQTSCRLSRLSITREKNQASSTSHGYPSISVCYQHIQTLVCMQTCIQGQSILLRAVHHPQELIGQDLAKRGH